jgi:hypothetical protein
MRKKQSKFRKTFYKKGHQHKKSEKVCPNDEIASTSAYDIVPAEEEESAQTWKRLPETLFNESVTVDEKGQVLPITDASGRESFPKLLRPLRPKQQPEPEYDNNKDTNRILHIGKTEQLWNKAIADHFPPPPCKGELSWDIENEVQRGLGWIIGLKCSCGHFTGEKMRLFDTIDSDVGKRGPKKCATNVGVQIGLTHTRIGPSALRNILLSSNIPAPSVRSMQTTANQVGDAIIKLNKSDMSEQRQHIGDVNEARGLPRDSAVRVEGDARYNNPLYSGSGTTPFQPATQAVYAVSENVTPNKKVVAVCIVNKMCSKGCQDDEQHEHNCKKNMGMSKQIGNEEMMAAEAYRSMKEDDNPVTISHFTSDGDSKAYKGIQSVDLDSKVEHLRDTRHLSGSAAKAVTNTKYSNGMFNCRTRASSDRARREFANNLKRRMNGEFSSAFQKHKGDIDEIVQIMPACIDAMLACYNGNCGLMCKKHSLVCKGLKTNKWDHSNYVQFIPHNALTPSDDDLKSLRRSIEVKLGPHALISQRFNTNTQKSEALNRAFSRTNPKGVLFKRNFEGRIHSAIHMRNRGIGDSTEAKCKKLKVPIAKNSRVSRGLRYEQRAEKSRSNHHKTTRALIKRRNSRLQKYESYRRKKLQDEEATYQKNMLDNQLFTVNIEHSYGTRSVTRGDHGYSKL